MSFGGCLLQIIGGIFFLSGISTGNTGVLVFGVIIFFLSIIPLSINQTNIAKEDLERKKQENISLEELLIHLGGHPFIKEQEKVLFQIREEEKIYLDNRYIPIGNIILCELKTQEQISKDVTFGRLIALGIFAFAVKKENKSIHKYIVLSYLLDGTKIDCILKNTESNQNLSNLSYSVNRILNKYKKTENISVYENVLSENKQSNQEKLNLNNKCGTNTALVEASEEIRELAKLKREDKITQDKHDVKKKDILKKREIHLNSSSKNHDKIDGNDNNTSDIKGGADIYDRLKKLNELKNLGILTEEEFIEKKKILLNKIN